MAEGIKLYNHFLEKLEEIGPVKRAWFTCFNLEIDFFERYILSALLGVPHENLVTPQDYEALTKKLANEGKEVDEDKTEVRVFFQSGKLDKSGRQKQTPVHLHPVDTRNFKKRRNNPDYSKGVFHPKVTLLETRDKKYWLMVSSANLTLAGWARNREGFFFDQITNKFQARAVGNFFGSLAESIKELGEIELLDKLQKGIFGSSNAKWVFHSSFDEDNFLDVLNDSDTKQALQVWSPYFAADLSGLLNNILSTHFESVTIIPAKKESQKIIITEKNYAAASAIKHVDFRQDKLPKDAAEAFVHAKVWLTPKKIAIGSWNMTMAGMNISPQGNNNIEAGIIHDISLHQYKQILQENETRELKNPLHFTDEEMEAEKQDLASSYAFTIDLIADWDTMLISLANPKDYESRLKDFGNENLILPGLVNKNVRDLAYPISFREHSSTLLTNRWFRIEKKDGTILSEGYLREKGLASRQPYGYNNMEDYLKAWLGGKPEERTDLEKLKYQKDDQERDEMATNTHQILTGTLHNDWFNSFIAFEKIMISIKEAMKLPRGERVIRLRSIGRVLPGSLSELRRHLVELQETISKNEKIKKERSIYLWFLIEKSNKLFSFFNEKTDDSNEHIAKIKNLDFKELFEGKNKESRDADALNKWKQFIIQKLKAD